MSEGDPSVNQTTNLPEMPDGGTPRPSEGRRPGFFWRHRGHHHRYLYGERPDGNSLGDRERPGGDSHEDHERPTDTNIDMREESRFQQCRRRQWRDRFEKYGPGYTTPDGDTAIGHQPDSFRGHHTGHQPGGFRGRHFHHHCRWSHMEQAVKHPDSRPIYKEFDFCN